MTTTTATTAPSGTKLQQVQELKGHIGWVKSLDFGMSGKKAVSGSEDKTARIWDLTTGAELFKLAGCTEAIGAVAFSPDEKFVATGSDDFSVRTWDAATGQQLKELIGHKNNVRAVTISSNSARIFERRF